jgi:hypothetical protein
MKLLEDLKEFDEGAKGCVPITWSNLIHEEVYIFLFHCCALLANFITIACGAFVDHCLL